MMPLRRKLVKRNGLEIFLKTFIKVLNDNAIIVTYCANGQVKRNLKAVGFEVES